MIFRALFPFERGTEQGGVDAVGEEGDFFMASAENRKAIGGSRGGENEGVGTPLLKCGNGIAEGMSDAIGGARE